MSICARRLFATVALSSLAIVADLRAQVSGTLEGDVFYRASNGDVKKGAGLEIRLLPDSLIFHDRRVSICSAWETEARQIASSTDSLGKLFDQAIKKGKAEEGQRLMDEQFSVKRLTAHIARADTAFSALFRSVSVANVSTDMNAHFKFATVRTGRYVIEARWPINGMPYSWFVPVEVIDAQPVSANLTNLNETLGKGQSYITRLCRTIR